MVSHPREREFSGAGEGKQTLEALAVALAGAVALGASLSTAAPGKGGTNSR